jgi:hypothetical protein
VYRSPAGLLGLIGSAVVAALLLVDALVRSGLVTTLLIAPWVLLVLWAVYVAVFCSVVTTDAAGITAQNFLRRSVVPWGAIADIELRYQLTIVTHDGLRIACFGGPASGRPRRTTEAGARVPRALREVDVIRDDWERAVREGAAGGPVVRSWDVPTLIALAVLVAAAAVAVAVSAIGA